MLLYDKDLNKALGKVPTLFLFQLAYWTKKGKRQEDGKIWVYNTQEEWSDQLGVSPRAFRYAVDKLKRVGIISTAYRAKNRYNRTLSYALEVRPDAKSMWQFISTSMWQGLPDPCGTDCHMNSNQKNTGRKSTQKELSHPAPTTAGEKERAPERLEDEEMKDIGNIVGYCSAPDLTKDESCGGGMKGSVSEIAKGLKKKIEGGPDLKDKGPYALAIYWKESIAAKTGEFQKPPTGKEIGQCKYLQKHYPGSPKEMVDKVISNWHGFTKKVRLDKGLTVSPDLPSLDYVISHLQVAIAWATVVKQVPKTAPTIATDFTLPPKIKIPEKNYCADAWKKPGQSSH